jgi:cyclic pyranopterin phosphate synthase
MLIDQFGRHATDLRISVTDRCNYRCVYCMPSHPQWLPKPEILSFEEIEFLTKIFAKEGVNQIRLTGGEPLVRRNIDELIRKLYSIEGIEDISLTTNGHFLSDLASTLKQAGIRRLNISLDSLRADRFAQITGSNSFEAVMKGIEESIRVGFDPIKINCVAMKGFNDDEIPVFLDWAKEKGLQIRFIEFMPLDGDHQWNRSKVLSQAEILELAQSYSPVRPVDSEGPAPAKRYSYSNGAGEFGVIPSVTEPFCDHCARIRLTADGKLRNCLFALHETDLKTPLRAGCEVEELIGIIRKNVYKKWAGHRINEDDFQQPSRAMNAIGG